MGKMKELFIQLLEEDEDRVMYYGTTPNDRQCPNCLETKMVEQVTDNDYECLFCGHSLILLPDGTLQIN
jgi:uncharacterized protein (DUF983 family)